MRRGNFSLKGLLGVLLIVILMSLLPSESNAAYPEKPIELVVPNPPGGSTDVLARLVSKTAAKYIPQPIVVINKAGGSEVIGREYVAHAKPDGYTLLMGYGSGADVVSPYNMKLPYDPLTDFKAICRFSAHPYVLCVPSSSPYSTFEELVDAAKKKGSLTIASAIKGSLSDLCSQVLGLKFEFKAVPIGFSGGAEAVTNLVRGQTDAGLGHPSEVVGHIKAGRLRPLLVTSKERIQISPFQGIPSLFEKGYDGPEFAAVKGVGAPKGVSDDVVGYLEEKFKLVSEDQEFIDGMNQVVQPILWMGAKEFQAYVADLNAAYGKYMRELGMAKY